MQVVYQSSGVVDLWRPNSGLKKYVAAGLTSGVLDLTRLDWLFDSAKIKEQRRYANGSVEMVLLDQPSEIDRLTRPYLERCKELGISLPLAVMPVCADYEEYLEQYEIFLKSCMGLCAAYGISSIMIPPMQADWTINRTFYDEIVIGAQDNKLQILLTNQVRNCNGHYIRGICCDAAEAADWIDRLNQMHENKCVGFFMDMRNCNICGQNMYEFAVALGSRIKAVRVCDSDGQTPSSLMPFSCVSNRQSKVDWLSFFRGMRKVEFDGVLMLDAGDSAAALSTLLKTDFLRYEKRIGEYLQFQIEIERTIKKYSNRVLFGAGNMCRNYMKCYGKEYPPLFTCDNNSGLWETEFEGLVIKNPEELKKLPDDCAIFICNLYYEEIQEQLETMGLNNPIEWFNDEYLPLKYTDWFDGSERKMK